MKKKKIKLLLRMEEIYLMFEKTRQEKYVYLHLIRNSTHTRETYIF